MIRGFQSDADDLLRRDIIQNLACHFRLDKRALSHKWNIDFERDFADELQRPGFCLAQPFYAERVAGLFSRTV